MEKIKKIEKSKINKIYNQPEKSGLAYKLYGKSENINDYSEREINEMILGIYRDKKYLLVDGDYFVNLEEVVKSECSLQEVSYYKKPTLETFKDNSCNQIGNIRTFYVKDYYIITQEPIAGISKHRITKYLSRIGFLNTGRGKYNGLFSIANDYQTMQGGKYPKDLYYPIKRYINGLFFDDDYKISDFDVITSLIITANS
ncbi:hypothetical protein ASG22_19695 [Chryseobacterium sp. Leaf405]|uniref:hypothetical protein n=1 Tax=Chryseobacterium sp. Leaf405 TaxID=1736367 RepID=UPI0006F9D6FA|nr:hypothetical protein [Chryseobacterium sp. Leaf405]KQT29550.1 hypothetical protein ASG22_19695 [Chryseobacterium sp. Leaf405]